MGLYEKMGATVIPSADTAGTDMSLVSESFRSEFASSDLVLAKGMGNWETLSELQPSGRSLPADGQVLPVARSQACWLVRGDLR